MGYNKAAQVLKKADALKAKVSAKKQDLLNDHQAWTDQQQLQTIYHQVLVLDLEYALDKKVEQDLWTIGFKNHISILQEQSRDKKNAHRSEAVGLLSWCLEAASGFYLTLLQEICSTYDMDLPFRKSGAIFGQIKNINYEPNETVPQPLSCLYICQYCLVHLGDIARYRNQRKQAESFYKHAILVSPNSGHPYNQLALLEASQGDKLSTVYYYIRGIAVKSPFPGAMTNLSSTLSLAIDKEGDLQSVQTKMSLNEFIGVFLKVHALIHTHSELKQAELCVKSINATLTALVATQSFTKEQLIQITIINIFALHHLGGKELTEDEIRARELASGLLAGSLSAFLLPVYTLKEDASILEYYALAAIRLLMMWIQLKPELLEEREFATRLQIWPGYCKLLNNISVHLDKTINFDDYKGSLLSYDKELEGFVPLLEGFNNNQTVSKGKLEAKLEDQMQAFHLINYGKWLTTFTVKGFKLIVISETDENKEFFAPGCIQPDPTDLLLEEMKLFKVSELEISKIKEPERKGGILKPQGSLEKSREERVKVVNGEEATNPITESSVKIKRATHNVALQSIFKKIEENKQVKFSADTNEKLNDTKQPSLQTNLSPSRSFSNSETHSGFNYKSNDNYSQHLWKMANEWGPKYHLPLEKTDNMNHANHTNFANNSNIGNGSNFASTSSYPMNMNREERPNFWPIQGPSQPPQQPPPQRLPQQPSMFNHQAQQQDLFNHQTQQKELYTQPHHQQQQQTMFNQQPAPNFAQQQNSYQRQMPFQDPDYLRFMNQNSNNSINSYQNSVRPPMVSALGPQRGGDMFNTPWSAPTNPNQLQGPPGLRHSSDGLSHPMSQPNLNSPPGYSLFNTSSWTPSLPGQLRGTNDLRSTPQHSFFTNAPIPQTLQQLVEQQRQFKKGDT